MTVDWRRVVGSTGVTDKQIEQLPALLQDLSGVATALVSRLATGSIDDVCLYPLDKAQICGVRLAFHCEMYGPREHGWTR